MKGGDKMKYEDIFKIGVKAKVPAGTKFEGVESFHYAGMNCEFDKETEVVVLHGCSVTYMDDEANPPAWIERFALVGYEPEGTEQLQYDVPKDYVPSPAHVLGAKLLAAEPNALSLVYVPFDSLVFEA
jgi:hypothetical protein